jgi:hypothetical protein
MTNVEEWRAAALELHTLIATSAVSVPQIDYAPIGECTAITKSP